MEVLLSDFESLTLKLTKTAHQLFLAGGIKSNKIIEGLSSASNEVSLKTSNW